MSRYLPGDIVQRRKGLVMHQGIALGDGRVLHNTPGRGEHISSEHEFRAGRRLHVSRQSLTERERALAHADRLRPRDYHLLRNNCEHTVSRASTGQAHSQQLKQWVAGVGVAGVAFALTRHPGIAAAGYALGRSLFGKTERGFGKKSR